MGAANPAMNRDDQPLPPATSVPEASSGNDLSILSSSILTHKSFYNLSQSLKTEVISSLVLEAQSSQSTQRTSVDLVLVIDVSGSMDGEKLDLVKKTLHFLLTQMGPSDRVSLVSFSDNGKRLCKLTCCDEIGKKRLTTFIRGLRTEGGTNLVDGLLYGLCVLAGRKMVNQSSAIILLTDGVDNDTYTAIDRAKEAIAKVPINKDYSIHTFGYGSDHDAKLLNEISDMKSGGFYFIDQFENIAQAFANCLGEVMSMLFDDIHVSIETQACEVPFSLTKVYSETEDNVFKLPGLIKGVKKEVVFVVELALGELSEDNVNIEPVRAVISYRDVKKDEKLRTEAILKILLKKEEGGDQINQEVMVNYYRFKAAESIKKAGKLGDVNNLEEAKHQLDECLDEIKVSSVSSHQMSNVLMVELEQAKRNFSSAHHYQNVGKISNIKSAKAHWNKRGETLECYQNVCQMDMILESKKFFSKNADTHNEEEFD